MHESKRVKTCNDYGNVCVPRSIARQVPTFLKQDSQFHWASVIGRRLSCCLFSPPLCLFALLEFLSDFAGGVQF